MRPRARGGGSTCRDATPRYTTSRSGGGTSRHHYLESSPSRRTEIERDGYPKGSTGAEGGSVSNGRGFNLSGGGKVAGNGRPRVEESGRRAASHALAAARADPARAAQATPIGGPVARREPIALLSRVAPATGRGQSAAAERGSGGGVATSEVTRLTWGPRLGKMCAGRRCVAL